MSRIFAYGVRNKKSLFSSKLKVVGTFMCQKNVSISKFCE